MPSLAVRATRTVVADALKHGQGDPCETVGADRPGAGRGQIDDPSRNVGPAIVDADDHRAAGTDVGDQHPRAERQRAMGGRQSAGVGIFAVGGFLVAVDRSNSALRFC